MQVYFSKTLQGSYSQKKLISNQKVENTRSVFSKYFWQRIITHFSIFIILLRVKVLSKSSNTSLLLPRFFYEFAFTFCISFSLKHSEKLERNGTAELPSPTVAGCLFYNFLLLLKYLTVDFWGEELVNFNFLFFLKLAILPKIFFL